MNFWQLVMRNLVLLQFQKGDARMSNDEYKQREGYDKYRNTSDGNTVNTGKAAYNSDGSLKRLDNYSPSSSSGKKHHHEWLEEKEDGTYEYGHKENDNH
jgi:hypothetical protein